MSDYSNLFDKPVRVEDSVTDVLSYWRRHSVAPFLAPAPALRMVPPNVWCALVVLQAIVDAAFGLEPYDWHAGAPNYFAGVKPR